MYCTCWCDNRRDCDTNIPGPSSLVRDILRPDSNQRDELGIVREDTPEILGPSLGACVDDGLSDLDESSDEEVVEISELQQFSWALQEALGLSMSALMGIPGSIPMGIPMSKLKPRSLRIHPHGYPYPWVKYPWVIFINGSS